MSHYTVLIAGDNIDERMEVFDEGLEVEHIVSKEEIIERAKEALPRYREMYKEYTDDPEKYISKYGGNADHVSFVANDLESMINSWDDEDWYAEGIKFYDNEDIDEESGDATSYYNPKSKYDWYQVGGRWAGLIKIKPRAKSGERGERSWTNESEDIDELLVDSALKRDIDWEHPKMKDFITFSFLTEEGVWIEEGEMGWFGSSNIKDASWDETFKKLIDEMEDNVRLTVVDCHI